MPNYFKLLRRKVGILTLVASCALAMGWVRSRSIVDYLQIPYGAVAYGLASMGGGVEFERKSDVADDPQGPSWGFECSSDSIARVQQFYRWGWTDANGDPMKVDHWDGWNVAWRWDWGGFHFGDASYLNSIREEIYFIPYWSIVIPLATFSAWLLLSKPRPIQSGMDPTI